MVSPGPAVNAGVQGGELGRKGSSQRLCLAPEELNELRVLDMIIDSLLCGCLVVIMKYSIHKKE